MIATRSPGASPSAIMPLATASTCPANSAAVTSDQSPSGERRLRTTCPGTAAALSKGRSARDPRRTGGANGGTYASRTAPSSFRVSGATRVGPGASA